MHANSLLNIYKQGIIESRFIIHKVFTEFHYSNSLITLNTIQETLAYPEVIEDKCCRNPWNPKCENSDVVLYIVFESTRYPICRNCWLTISESYLEW
jgi:hypothetical protein